MPLFIRLPLYIFSKIGQIGALGDYIHFKTTVCGNSRLGFYRLRDIYPLELQHGIQWIKYALVKYHLEKVLLFFGPVFLKIVRGE